MNAPEGPDVAHPVLPSVSIVVPVRNEEQRIEGALRRLRHDFPDCELVVVDGGSTDRTSELAVRWAPTLRSAAGRARQMNAGAEVTRGEVLWFVHVDTRVPPEALGLLRRAVTDPDVVGGGLRLRFDQRSPALAWLAFTSNLRARYLHWVFGDQAMFVRREVFDSVCGFPELPLMEDLELSRRLRRRGRLAVLPATATASSRRIAEQGVWQMIALMQYLKLQYFLGVDPERIRRRYEAGTRRGRRGAGSPPSSEERRLPVLRRLRPALERRLSRAGHGRRGQNLPLLAGGAGVRRRTGSGPAPRQPEAHHDEQGDEHTEDQVRTRDVHPGAGYAGQLATPEDATGAEAATGAVPEPLPKTLPHGFPFPRHEGSRPSPVLPRPEG